MENRRRVSPPKQSRNGNVQVQNDNWGQTGCQKNSTSKDRGGCWMQNTQHHAANNKTTKQENSLTINQDRLAIIRILFMQQSRYEL